MSGKKKLKVICIIPARLGSTRLEKKPIADIHGKPLIRRVYESVANAPLLDEVIVATDDDIIVDLVKSFGGKVMLTPKDLQSGTDRVAYASNGMKADVIINLQGDEVFVRPEMMQTGLAPFINNPDTLMGSLKTRLKDSADLFNPNVVKVVTDKDDNALYFSRFPIPYLRDEFSKTTDAKALKLNMDETVYYKHLGIYLYKPDFLRKFSKMPMSYLEKCEKLEQLRALENGYKIVVPTTEFDCIGVDTKEDLEKVRGMMKREHH